jgi:hypothetical protein
MSQHDNGGNNYRRFDVKIWLSSTYRVDVDLGVRRALLRGDAERLTIPLAAHTARQKLT